MQLLDRWKGERKSKDQTKTLRERDRQVDRQTETGDNRRENERERQKLDRKMNRWEKQKNTAQRYNERGQSDGTERQAEDTVTFREIRNGKKKKEKKE